MNGMTAVVTGGGMGLGRATAIGLAQAGYNVAVIGRTKSKCDETAALIGEHCLSVQADLVDPAQVAAAFRQVDDRFGRVDVLVNNAAAYRIFLVEKATDTEIDEVVNGTLKAAIYCIREAIPRMRALGGGDIVNVSSESVRLPAPYLLVYAGAKAALETLTAGLRGELKGSGIRSMIFQAGVITEHSSTNASVSSELSDAFTERFVNGGFAQHYSPPGLTPEVMAVSLVQMITAPRPANVEFMSMRHI
jgi:NAD(P)-dependent dehydrogenase (short-subunit alcohol dehydrogenase family)